MSQTLGAARPLRILRRTSSNLAVDAAITSGTVRSFGFRRVQAYFVLATGMAPAAGYPRVRFSNDGTSWINRVITQDFSQAGVVAYTYDGPVEGFYMVVELTNGAAVAGNAYAWAQLVPGGA